MISKREYQMRRSNLSAQLPASSLALIPAASESLRNGDSHYRFRQDSDFYYLTGLNEPDALLVVVGGNSGESILFNRPPDALQEKWTGKRLGQDDACEALGVSMAFSLETLEVRLPELFTDKQAIYYSIGRHPTWEQRILAAWSIVKAQQRRGTSAPNAFCDLSTALGEMRLFKSKSEIELMRRAANISVAAHQRAIKACQRVTNEGELEAELLYEFFRQGCRSVAYDSIVAGGANACVLHYTDNNKVLQPGELILVDAGGEFENYAADITRTFPYNGTFTPEQKLIYELVLKAQKAAISSLRPGALWNEAQDIIVKILCTGLVELGLLNGSVSELIEQGTYRQFYMHQSGHWLGIDVHDVGAYKKQGKWRALEPGMVLTIEPGLYISPDIPGVDAKWHNIGVRIEDDILVTDEGYENLTAELAVEVDDLEALLRG